MVYMYVNVYLIIFVSIFLSTMDVLYAWKITENNSPYQFDNSILKLRNRFFFKVIEKICQAEYQFLLCFRKEHWNYFDTT